VQRELKCPVYHSGYDSGPALVQLWCRMVWNHRSLAHAVATMTEVAFVGGRGGNVIMLSAEVQAEGGQQLVAARQAAVV